MIQECSMDESTWSVNPTPGFVIKFRNVSIPNEKISLISSKNKGDKFFINLAHCLELPPPDLNLTEDQIAVLITSDPNAFKIPFSIGDIDYVEDKSNEKVPKVDVVLNSTFFHKRIQTSEFIRQLTIGIILQTIETKFAISLDIANQIILKNKKLMGILNVQRIRKKPIDKIETSKIIKEEEISTLAEEENPHGNMDIDSLNEMGTLETKKPRNYRVQIINEEFADIRIRVRDQQDQLVDDANRIRLKMNNDRCVVILDGAQTVTDFYLPYYLVDSEAVCVFDPITATLKIQCPIDWKQF